MIVGPSYVFPCVPRAASQSIALHWLKNYGGEPVMATAKDGTEYHDYHRMTVPQEHVHKFTFAVVRNPYSRMRSLWNLVRGEFRESLGLPPGMTGAQFVRWCMGRKDDARFVNQCEFLRDIRVDRVVRFESLRDDLKELPFVGKNWVEPPHISATEDQEMPREFRRAVNEFAAPVFKQFGYVMRYD